MLPTLPQLPGITSAARYLVSGAHAQVGGDWYDLFALPDGAIGIAIGDVMGHDLAAAAAMGQLRSVLRSYAYEGSSPSVVLDRLDRLVQDFDMAQLATAIYGRLVLDERSGNPLDGAAMLLYTDGLVETRTTDLDAGISRLAAELASLDPGAAPEQVCEALVSAMARPGQDDDIALLALRIDLSAPA